MFIGILFLVVVAVVVITLLVTHIGKQQQQEWGGEVRLCFGGYKSPFGSCPNEGNTWYIGSEDSLVSVFLVGAIPKRIPLVGLTLWYGNHGSSKDLTFSMKWYVQGIALELREELYLEPGDWLELKFRGFALHDGVCYVLHHESCLKGQKV